jgi:Gpi18-like mannosyltransferase
MGRLTAIFGKNDLLFPAVVWLINRLFILAVMLLIAPMLKAPPGGVAATFGWEVFEAWDSEHYWAIATTGYEYANDGKGHNIAFFPLYPLIIKGLISIGLPFQVAGTLVNNLAFLAALYFLYFWIKKQHSLEGAKWSTLVLAWFPASIFTSVIYTEGLYLLLSTAALQAFDQQQYRWTTFWGALATATRPTGITLIPAFLIAARVERRPPIAYIAGLATATGILLFSLYCAVQYGEPLAFIQAQRGWRSSIGFDWQSWWKMLMQISVGTANWKHGWIKDPLHPILFGIILSIGYILWRCRQKLGSIKMGYGFAALFLFLWLLAGDPLINTITVVGGGYLLWHLRSQLTPITVIYGFCGLGLIFVSGGTWSLSRIAYGIVPLSVALGILLSRYISWAKITLAFFAILVATFAIRFAQNLWVG